MRTASLFLAWMMAASAWADVGSLPVYVEDSPAAQELVEEAVQLRSQQRTADAVERLQQVIEQYPRKLMPVGSAGDNREGRFVDAKLFVEGRLTEDAELGEAYRRRYDAEAERALTLTRSMPVLSRAEALDALIARYALTTAGIEASLDRAALGLEEADGATAWSLLSSAATHPGLDAHRDRYHLLCAVTAIFTDDAASRDEHRAALADLGDEQSVALVDRMASSILATGNAIPSATFDVPPADAGPLWRVALDPAPGGDLSGLRRALPQRMQKESLSPISTIEPGVGGADVVVSNGLTVRSLDRFSGRLNWTVRGIESGPNAEALAAMMGRVQMSSPSHGVLLAGTRVYAVLGSAAGMPARLANNLSTARLLSLDRRTGAQRWSVEPGELDASLDRAYFEGAPLAELDRVYAILRRTQVTGFQDAFVVAIDARTGRPIWRRHVSSTVTANRFGLGPSPVMVRQGSTLFVSDQLGAIAAIDARDGAMRWLRVFPMSNAPADGDRPNLVRQFRPGQQAVPIADPIVAPAGLVVSLTSDLTGRLLLDPATGDTLRELDATAIGKPSQLINAGDGIVGLDERTVTLYDGQSLEPIWQTAAPEPDPFVGTPAIDGEYLAVGTRKRISIFDLAKGKRVLSLPIDEPGNVVLRDGQVVLASSDALVSYLDWDRAIRALDDRFAADPRSYATGLAMAYLGVTHGRSDAAIDGIDHALAALDVRALANENQPDVEAREAVFTELIDLTNTGKTIDPTIRRTMFDRVATLASGPAQEAIYHLSFGAFLADQNLPKEAVEHYQSILLDDALALQLYRRPTLTRQAGLEARRRIEELIASKGRGVYADFDRLAAQRLTELARPTAVEPEALVRLAEQYPMALVAPEALYRAGSAFTARNDPKRAVRQLRAAYHVASEPELLSLIVGDLVSLHTTEDRPQLAAHWLRRAGRDHPGLAPLRDGVATPVDLWLMELSMLDRVADSRPRLDPPLGDPIAVPGTLLLPIAQGDLPTPNDRFVTRDAHRVAMYFGSGVTPSWEVQLDADAQLVALTDQQALFWSDRDARLIGFDAETGEPAWPSVGIETVLDRVGDPGQRDDLRPREQRQFVHDLNPGAMVVRGGQLVLNESRPPPGYLIAVNESIICVSDRAGRVAAIDRLNGEPLWQQLGSVDRLDRIAIDDQYVALVGATFPDTPTENTAIVILDTISGTPRLPPIEPNEPIRWLGFNDDGLLLTVGEQSVTAYHPADGGVPWRLDLVGRKGSDVNWTGGGLLLAVTESNASPTRVLMAIDTAGGRVLNRLAIPPGRAGAVDAQYADDAWYVTTPGSAFALGKNGSVLWRDALAPLTPKHFVAGGVTDRLMILDSLDASGDDPAGVVIEEHDVVLRRVQEDHHRLWFLERDSGLIRESQTVDQPLRSPWQMLTLDGRLILGGEGQTLILPAQMP